MKNNKIYLLALLFPLAIFSIENISLRNDFKRFNELFQDYKKVKGNIHSLDCANHNYFDVIHENIIYKEVLYYTFSNCWDYKPKASIDFYISKVNPRIASINKPESVVREYEFAINSTWLIFLFFGIPILLFIKFAKSYWKKKEAPLT